MQIFQRQRQIFRERSVMRHDSKNRPSRTVRLQSTLAKIANWQKSIGRTGHVDLAGDAFAYPPLLRRRGNSSDVSYLADKFMSRRAAKPVVATQNLHVRVANTGQPHANQGPTRPQLRDWLLHLGQPLALHHKADHLRSIFLCEQPHQLSRTNVILRLSDRNSRRPSTKRSWLERWKIPDPRMGNLSAVPGAALPQAPLPAPGTPFADQSATGRPRFSQLPALRLQLCACGLPVRSRNVAHSRCGGPLSAAIAPAWSPRRQAIGPPQFRPPHPQPRFFQTTIS